MSKIDNIYYEEKLYDESSYNLIEIFKSLKLNDDKEISVKINKGNGGGGKNTNVNGKSFEQITDIENKLFENKFEKKIFKKGKHGYYLYKNTNNKIIYLSQNGLKSYFKIFFNIELFRCPDEAYIIEKDEKYIIKILEKKAQYVEGSVETKLWSGPSLKREYEIIMGEKFLIEYAFSVSNFLKEKINSDNEKYKILKQILCESNINIFYGEDEKYFDNIYEWINNF
jgi:hypothetical protein